MFDVGSALIGAVSGGGITGLIWLVTRRDTRRASRQSAIEEIVRAVIALQNATRGTPIGATSITGDAVALHNDLHVATLRLEPFLRDRDPHTEWVMAYVSKNVLFPVTKVSRESAAGVIGARLLR
jgi:hypothetical protein